MEWIALRQLQSASRTGFYQCELRSSNLTLIKFIVLKCAVVYLKHSGTTVKLVPDRSPVGSAKSGAVEVFPWCHAWVSCGLGLGYASGRGHGAARAPFKVEL